MREADGGSPHASPAREHSVWQKVPDHPISYAGTSLPPYSPFTPFSSKLVTVTVSATRACAVEVAFLAPGVPARLSGAGSLNYDVQQSSATTSLLYTGAFPVATAHIDISAGLVG